MFLARLTVASSAFTHFVLDSVLPHRFTWQAVPHCGVQRLVSDLSTRDDAVSATPLPPGSACGAATVNVAVPQCTWTLTPPRGHARTPTSNAPSRTEEYARAVFTPSAVACGHTPSTPTVHVRWAPVNRSPAANQNSTTPGQWRLHLCVCHAPTTRQCKTTLSHYITGRLFAHPFVVRLSWAATSSAAWQAIRVRFIDVG